MSNKTKIAINQVHTISLLCTKSIIDSHCLIGLVLDHISLVKSLRVTEDYI